MATSSAQTPALESNSSELNHFIDKLMKKICVFYDEQSLVDVSFKVSNPTAIIPAHRLILAAASPYFENLFNGHQGINPVIEITDIDSDVFERIITFCYTGQALITVNNVGAMLKAAIVLQLDDIITSCVDYLMTHINEFTLQAAHTLARETQCECLKKRINEHEIQNFMEISRSDEFLNFDVEKLQCILESEKLNINREKDAYDAIHRWFSYDVPARQEQLPLLIACLRLTQFDADFLLTHIQPLPGCELLAFKALSWSSDPAARPKINIRFTKPREGNAGNCGEKTLLASCYDWSSKNVNLLQYNKAEDKWQEYAIIKSDYSSNRTIIMDDNILFIGGGNGGASNIARSWNIRNKTWLHLANMKVARWLHCVVELDGNIYAIGGRNSDSTLSSVERYTTSGGWEYVKSLNVGRCSASAVTFNGKIYVVGGINDRRTESKSVECYNPDSNTWTSCADMRNDYQWSPGVAAYNGHIYVAGDKSVERYDPQRNMWSQICSLEDFHSSLVSLDNKLWAIGGTFHLVYDENNNRWQQKCSIPKSNVLNCFVVPESLLSSK
ncbi:kelch-like protein 5 [Bactrocera oleae]|uniref:kelch-like protein 5 n=1 Tax=Bactrocera oleae TaxID=104688 RepID=UPI00387ED127